MNYTHVYIDVETTGLDNKKDEIVEVVAIEFDLNGNMGNEIAQLCSPISGFIPREASEIHGIYMSEVEGKPNYLKDKVREKIAEFINTRTLVGHNLKEFDLGFLKIKPQSMEDTLIMCRQIYKGGNKLKTACLREGIKWDDKEAHRAGYDVRKGIELYIKLKTKKEFVSPDRNQQTLFATLPSIIEENLKKIGVTPTDNDKKLLATQAYSFSRIQLFHQCPYKWFMQYIRGFKQPDVDYLLTGSICHRIAQVSSDWCYRELWSNKFQRCFEHFKGKISKELKEEISKCYKRNFSEISIKEISYFLYDNPKNIKEYDIGTGIANLAYEMDRLITGTPCESPSMPDLETYESIIRSSILYFKCTDPGIIADVNKIMMRFYLKQDFSLHAREITVSEKRMSFNKDWKMLQDFYSYETFFRGIIDVIDYYGDDVIITDYKTSRVMMNEEGLKNDMQLKIYVLLVSKFLPKDSFKRIIIRINYIRYGKILEYIIPDWKTIAQDALDWIYNSIQQIEKEILLDKGEAFKPIRNHYCHICHLAEDGVCPLFNKLFIEKIENVDTFIVNDIKSCQNAWKRIEANKAENSRLAKLCKTFVDQCDSTISIDEKAVLDYYVSEYREYDPKETAKFLLENNVSIEYFINFFSISESEFEKLMVKKGILPNDNELNRISKVKFKKNFDAFTEEEAKEKGFINS